MWRSLRRQRFRRRIGSFLVITVGCRSVREVTAGWCRGGGGWARFPGGLGCGRRGDEGSGDGWCWFYRVALCADDVVGGLSGFRGCACDGAGQARSEERRVGEEGR